MMGLTPIRPPCRISRMRLSAVLRAVERQAGEPGAWPNRDASPVSLEGSRGCAPPVGKTARAPNQFVMIKAGDNSLLRDRGGFNRPCGRI